MTTTAIVKLTDTANIVVNIVKAKYDLKDKSEALNKLIEEYSTELLEPELKPEFIKRIKTIEKKGKFIKINNLNELWE